MDAREQIQANVELAIEQLGPLVDFDFGLNRESVQWVEGFIERQREREGFDPEDAGGLIGVIGSFLGECIVAATGGRWEWAEAQGHWCVQLANNNKAFPFVKVEKQFRQGLSAGESTFSFYTITVDYVATGRFDEERRSDPA